MNVTNFKEKPYFDSLPRYTLPALQAAFDKALNKGFSSLAIYNGLCRDLDEVGHEKPTQQVFNAWLDGVQKGHIARPGGARIVAAEAETVVTGVDLATGPDLSVTTVVTVEGGKPFFTPVFPAEEAGTLVERMIAEAKADLSRDLEGRAKRLVAERLRLLAASIEGDAR
ncbi:hypothetical protein [Rhizobium arsenicireducens]